MVVINTLGILLFLCCIKAVVKRYCVTAIERIGHVSL